MLSCAEDLIYLDQVEEYLWGDIIYCNISFFLFYLDVFLLILSKTWNESSIFPAK